MRIGYLGVGTIAAHMVEGFCGLDASHTFFLSPRNEKKSKMLAEKYSNCVLCGSNQEVVDESEVVFISMNASSCPEALTALNFKESRLIVNLVATIPPEDILSAVGSVRGFYHVVPLPFIERRVGPIAAFPEGEEIKSLLSPLGTVVFAESMDEIRTMQAITALMSTFYETLHGLVLYAEAAGMEQDKAKAFTAAFFGALCARAETETKDFRGLALEMTPGGLNEFCLKTLEDLGITRAWADILPHVMKKIKPIGGLN